MNLLASIKLCRETQAAESRTSQEYVHGFSTTKNLLPLSCASASARAHTPKNSSTASRITPASGSTPVHILQADHALVDQHPQPVERRAAAVRGRLAINRVSGGLKTTSATTMSGCERADANGTRASASPRPIDVALISTSVSARHRRSRPPSGRLRLHATRSLSSSASSCPRAACD